MKLSLRLSSHLEEAEIDDDEHGVNERRPFPFIQYAERSRRRLAQLKLARI